MSEAAASLQPPRRLGRPYTLLLITTLVMVGIGLVMILSASSVEAFKRYGSSFLFFNKQVIGAIVGVLFMFVVSKTDYHHLRKLAGPLMLIAIGLLIAVLIPGVGSNRAGSSRWIPLGVFNLQPSEFAKLALVIYSAHILERKGKAIKQLREMALPLLPVIGLIGLLVMAQPDMGTAVICSGCGFVVLFLAGTRGRHLAGVVAAGGVAVVGLALNETYRRARIGSFLNPWADPLNAGYQNIQGQIALGTGRLFGVGLGASRQKWSYVPNAHTDFIYAILGEELGLAGTLSVLMLFVFFLYLGARVARKAPDRFGFLLAGGITGWIGLQAVINMAAVAGLVPITGVPLPLISFGGSSLVFTMGAIGIMLSIAQRGRA